MNTLCKFICSFVCLLTALKSKSTVTTHCCRPISFNLISTSLHNFEYAGTFLVLIYFIKNVEATSAKKLYKMILIYPSAVPFGQMIKYLVVNEHEQSRLAAGHVCCHATSELWTQYNIVWDHGTSWHIWIAHINRFFILLPLFTFYWWNAIFLRVNK